ncbi:hypothetical protein L7F22_003127 [Adiantum nelumboides]|nr:hypothetical protein [Adiantum nelumboides]
MAAMNVAAMMRGSLRSATATGMRSSAAAPTISSNRTGIFQIEIRRGYADQAKDEKNSSSSSSKSTQPSDKQNVDFIQPPAQQSTTPSQNRSASAFDIDTSALVAAVEEEQAKQTTGARSRSSRQSSQEKSKRLTGRILTVGALGGSGFIIQQLGREWDTVEEREKHGNNPLSDNFLGRLRLRMADMYSSVKAPAWEKLLPDPLPFPYQRPYTLVLDVDDLLIHSEWSRQHAWRTAKRPGLDYFLGYLSQWYEIVLFSRQPVYIVAPVVEKLDPDMRIISYTLFRESCRMLDNGHVVKDLSHLNRDLSKVIAIDTSPEALELHPENAIVLNPWKGDSKDTDLVGLISFLEAIGIYNIQDVRQTLKAYEGTHIPTEHIKRQKQLKEREEEEWKTKHAEAKSSFLGGLRGASAKGGEMPKTWYELEQERFRQGYLEDQKYWKENGEALRQQAKDEQEKKLKELKLNAWGFLTGAAMQPPPQEGQQA